MSSALTLKFIFFFQAMKISYLPQPFLSIMDSREQYSLGFLYSISSFLLNPLVVFTEQVLQIISLILLRINPFIFYFPAHPPLLHQIAYVLFSHRQTCQKTERLFSSRSILHILGPKTTRFGFLFSGIPRQTDISLKLKVRLIRKETFP